LCRELDVNGSGIIDVADLRAVVNAYGARVGSIEYSLARDANADGVIDVQDLRVLFFLYGFPPCF
jgi:Ca2+-binding EF-hand superfamily protein